MRLWPIVFLSVRGNTVGCRTDMNTKIKTHSNLKHSILPISPYDGNVRPHFLYHVP